MKTYLCDFRAIYLEIAVWVGLMSANISKRADNFARKYIRFKNLLDCDGSYGVLAIGLEYC